MRRLIAFSVLLLASSIAQATTADEDAVGLTERVASVVHSDLGNCSKMASDLNALHAKNEGLIQQLRARFQSRPLSREYEPRMDAAMKNIAEGASTCGNDPNVQAAIDGFPR